jgi:hypothetical protein
MPPAVFLGCTSFSTSTRFSDGSSLFAIAAFSSSSCAASQKARSFRTLLRLTTNRVPFGSGGLGFYGRTLARWKITELPLGDRAPRRRNVLRPLRWRLELSSQAGPGLKQAPHVSGPGRWPISNTAQMFRY